MHNHLLMLTKRATVITAGAVLIAMTTTGCGSGKKKSPPNPVQISPNSSVSLSVSGTQQFTATVNGTVSPVFWSLKSTPADGTITAGGLYTAPAAPGFYTVTATNPSNSAQSNSVVVSVVAGSASGTLQ